VGTVVPGVVRPCVGVAAVAYEARLVPLAVESFRPEDGTSAALAACGSPDQLQRMRAAVLLTLRILMTVEK